MIHNIYLKWCDDDGIDFDGNNEDDKDDDINDDDNNNNIRLFQRNQIKIIICRLWVHINKKINLCHMIKLWLC